MTPLNAAMPIMRRALSRSPSVTGSFASAAGKDSTAPRTRRFAGRPEQHSYYNAFPWADLAICSIILDSRY